MKIKMILLADAIPGSGNSIAGVIDREISYDSYGFPYIPSKRIKGILRESAENLRMPHEKIKEIFGVRGSDKSCPLILDNGRLPNIEELHSNYDNFNRKNSNYKLNINDVLNYFTYTRSQTTIDRNGIAKDKSLRISRVLKKGLIFNFHLEVPEEYVEDFERICLVTRSFGSSRNRGFGEIKLVLDRTKDDDVKKIVQADINTLEYGKINLNLKNESQLLVSNGVGMSQVSDDYIPGNFILGALAYSYIREKKSVDDSFHDLFLSGKVKFGNLYPKPTSSKSSREYYPSPLSVKKVKSSKKAPYLINRYFDLSNVELDELDDNLIFKGGFSGYVSSGNYKMVTSKEIESHHARSEDRGIAKSNKKEGDFYQFEVMAPDQSFQGQIMGPMAMLEKVKELLDKSNILRIGKSKTGQYAKCSYAPVNIDRIDNESIEWRRHEELKLIAQSDLLLYNENGHPEPTADCFKYNIGEYFNINNENPEELEILNAFLDKADKGGFVGVWKLPKIQVPVIRAGSVIILKNNTNSDIKIENEVFFIGERVEEGYGRIKVSDFGDDSDFLYTLEDSEYNSNKEECEQFNDLLSYVIDSELRRYLNFQAIQLEREKINKSNSSTLAKVKLLIKNSNSFSEFEDFLGELKSESQKNNLYKLEKLLYLKSKKIESERFKQKIMNLPGYPPIFKDKVNNNPFKYYQYYVISLLDQIKLSNRRK
jgi:CRISPR-associated protein Csx10